MIRSEKMIIFPLRSQIMMHRMEIKSTEQLVLLLNNDITEAFDMLFFRYHAPVYNFALRLLKSATDAEEIVQEVFMAVWQNRGQIKADQKFTSYLFGITRNQVHLQIRRRVIHYHYLNMLETDPDQVKAFIHEQSGFDEIREFFDRQIDQLPPRRREIFMLSRVEQLSYKEIAARLNISENTVDSQIRHALNFLKNKYELFFKKY